MDYERTKSKNLRFKMHIRDEAVKITFTVHMHALFQMYTDDQMKIVTKNSTKMMPSCYCRSDQKNNVP